MMTLKERREDEAKKMKRSRANQRESNSRFVSVKTLSPFFLILLFLTSQISLSLFLFLSHFVHARVRQKERKIFHTLGCHTFLVI